MILLPLYFPYFRRAFILFFHNFFFFFFFNICAMAITHTLSNTQHNIECNAAAAQQPIQSVLFDRCSFICWILYNFSFILDIYFISNRIESNRIVLFTFHCKCYDWKLDWLVVCECPDRQTIFIIHCCVKQLTTCAFSISHTHTHTRRRIQNQVPALHTVFTSIV